MTTISDLIAEAERNADKYIYGRINEDKFIRAKDNEALRHWLGRLESLRAANACRLTTAETAVIDAALEMTGPRSPRLAMALACLRRERGSQGKATAEQVIDDGYLSEVCEDCGSSAHKMGSVYCRVRQQDDCDD